MENDNQVMLMSGRDSVVVRMDAGIEFTENQKKELYEVFLLCIQYAQKKKELATIELRLCKELGRFAPSCKNQGKQNGIDSVIELQEKQYEVRRELYEISVDIRDLVSCSDKIISHVQTILY